MTGGLSGLTWYGTDDPRLSPVAELDYELGRQRARSGLSRSDAQWDPRSVKVNVLERAGMAAGPALAAAYPPVGLLRFSTSDSAGASVAAAAQPPPAAAAAQPPTDAAARPPPDAADAAAPPPSDAAVPETTQGAEALEMPVKRPTKDVLAEAFPRREAPLAPGETELTPGQVAGLVRLGSSLGYRAGADLAKMGHTFAGWLVGQDIPGQRVAELAGGLLGTRVFAPTYGAALLGGGGELARWSKPLTWTMVAGRALPELGTALYQLNSGPTEPGERPEYPGEAETPVGDWYRRWFAPVGPGGRSKAGVLGQTLSSGAGFVTTLTPPLRATWAKPQTAVANLAMLGSAAEGAAELMDWNPTREAPTTAVSVSPREYSLVASGNMVSAARRYGGVPGLLASQFVPGDPESAYGVIARRVARVRERYAVPSGGFGQPVSVSVAPILQELRSPVEISVAGIPMPWATRKVDSAVYRLGDRAVTRRVYGSVENVAREVEAETLRRAKESLVEIDEVVKPLVAHARGPLGTPQDEVEGTTTASKVRAQLTALPDVFKRLFVVAEDAAVIAKPEVASNPAVKAELAGEIFASLLRKAAPADNSDKVSERSVAEQYGRISAAGLAVQAAEEYLARQVGAAESVRGQIPAPAVPPVQNDGLAIEFDFSSLEGVDGGRRF